MQTYERAPRIKHAEQTPSRTFIKFLAQPGQELVMQGSVLPYDSIVRHPQGHSYYERTAGEVHWAGISMPVDDLEAATIAVRGCGLAPLHNRMIVVPTFQAMTRLRQLHGSIAAMAANAPGTLTAPEVAHGLEQSLIEAIVGCLSGPEEHEATWAQRCHETIMRRFFRLLEENPTRPIFVPEFCSAIRVPERTLRACCQEHFGMGPKQYLLLRRMTLAHRAVQAANPVETTVTEVAIRFGFWPSTGLPANTGHVRRSAIGHAWHRQAAQQNRPNPVSFRRDHMRLNAAAGTHGGRPACGSGGHLCHS
jgi:AraC-like DNA-binding protein